MDGVATITARMGLDTGGFTSDLVAAEQRASASMGRISAGSEHAAASQEKFITSGRRAARSITRVSKEALSGADATQVFAGALEGLERSLRLPLGSLAGLAIIAVVIGQMDKANDAAINFSKGLKDLAHMGIDELNKKAEEATDLSKPGFGKLVRMLTGAQDLVESAKGQIEEAKTGAMHRTGRKISDEGYLDELRNNATEAGMSANPKDAGYAKSKSELTAKRQELADKEAEERRSMMGKQDIGIIDALDRKYAALRKNIDLEERELEIKKQSILLDQAHKESERGKLTLAELATGPQDAKAATHEGGDVVRGEARWQGGQMTNGTIQAWYAAKQAREVIELEASAKDKRLRFQDTAGAKSDEDRADVIRNSIGMLKDSEKSDKYQIDIANNTAQIAKNTAELSFKSGAGY